MSLVWVGGVEGKWFLVGFRVEVVDVLWLFCGLGLEVYVGGCGEFDNW